MIEDIKTYNDNLQIRAIAEKIKINFDPAKIILFGSSVYGKSISTSDVDIFVIMKTNLKFYNMILCKSNKSISE